MITDETCQGGACDIIAHHQKVDWKLMVVNSTLSDPMGPLHPLCIERFTQVHIKM